MKSKLLFLSGLFGLVASSQAAVTLQMSSTSNFLTNFLNGAGAGGGTLAWGIVVDASGNGFQGTAENPYMPFGNISTNTAGTVLSTLTGGASDDVLYISSNLMNLTTNTNDGAVLGLNRVTNLSNIVYGNGVGQGDIYRLIWFDVTNLSSASAVGTKYGMYELPAVAMVAPWGANANTLPADPGTYSAAPASAGADAPKSMGFTLGVAIPEPSAALLGAIGALGLLRRRRA
jgi:hypothetical protein